MNCPRLMGRSSWLALTMPVLWVLASGCSSSEKEPAGRRVGASTAYVLSPDPVPVEIVDDHVLVRATLNGREVRLVLDTGASHLAVSPEAAAATGIREAGRAGFGAFGGERGSAKLGVAESVVVGPAVAKDVATFIFPIPPVFEADGFLGLSFLRQFAVRLDYEHKLLSFAPPASSNLTGVGPGVALQGDGRLVIQAEVDGAAAKLVVDTGAGQSLILRSWFVDEQKLRARYPRRLNVVTGGGLLGLTRGEISRLQTLKLGGHTLTNVFVEFETGTDNRRDDIAGFIGAGILSRFNLTFDPAGKRMWFEPNSSRAMAPLPSATLRSGLVWLPEGTVADIIPGSPAAEAGVRLGDRLLEVDGVPVQTLRFKGVNRALRAEPGTRVRLRLQTDGEAPREVILILRDLL